MNKFEKKIYTGLHVEQRQTEVQVQVEKVSKESLNLAVKKPFNFALKEESETQDLISCGSWFHRGTMRLK